MPEIEPDDSSRREALPLGEWLLRLVADERAVRNSAGRALVAMRHAFSPNIEESDAAFQQAIRVAVVAPGFDTAAFVRRLCATLVAVADDWRRQIARSAEEDYAVDDGEAILLTSAMAGIVFQALDQAFLAAPEALQGVLQHPQQAYQALAALERIGPSAVAFAPRLLEIIQPGDNWEGSRAEGAARAMGAIARDNGELIDEIRRSLRDARVEVHSAAALALTCLGTKVAGREQEIVGELTALLANGGGGYVIHALASVGRHIPEARRRVLELAQPRPPVWESVPWFPSTKHDRVMTERADAIDAMRYLADYPDECMPVLVEAVDSFREPSPDCGPTSRIEETLKCFGPTAGPLAVALAARLRTAVAE